MSKLCFSLYLIGLIGLFNLPVLARNSAVENQSGKYPVIVGWQFHNFSLPFQDIPSHFHHPGLFAGSELPLNRSKNLFQSAVIGAYLNKEMGDGLYIYSQTSFRPSLHKKFLTEVKGGLGYAFILHPVAARKYEADKWQTITGGKSQLIIPLEISLGYHLKPQSKEFTPFLAYQLTPALFYNRALPFSIYSNILLGMRFKI